MAAGMKSITVTTSFEFQDSIIDLTHTVNRLDIWLLSIDRLYHIHFNGNFSLLLELIK